MHARASLDHADVIINVSTGEPPIDVQFNNILNYLIAKKCEKLKSIIDCVIVLGKQTIAYGDKQPQ